MLKISKEGGRLKESIFMDVSYRVVGLMSRKDIS